MKCITCNSSEDVRLCCLKCGRILTEERKINIALIVLAVIVMFCVTTLWICLANAQEFSDEEIVNAIYKAEGCHKHCDYAYGIRSVHYESETEARRICFNTVKNNRKRFAEYGHRQFGTYLEFLASRYCPIGAENDPKGLNKHWIKNVKYFLNKGRES